VQTTWAFLAMFVFSIMAGLVFKALGIAFSAGAVLTLIVGICAAYLAARLNRKGE
jgi:hypothetical protein